MVAILAVLTISGEYGSGMIRTTLTAMPDRLAVLAAKATLLATLVVAAGAVAVLGSVLYLGLIALLSFGVAVIARDPAVAAGVVLALLYLFPVVLAFIGNAHWQHRLERWSPTIAGLNIQATTGLRGLAISPWGGLGVLGLWAAAALVLGALTFRLRDA